MRARRTFSAVDSHTAGMPTRVVTGGVGVLPGATMARAQAPRRARARPDLRTLLMHEPHGHGAMSGAILQPPTRPDADWGVVFIEVSGCLPMCGHGTIGVATVLVETGMVEVSEPETIVRLDVPAGLVEARVAVRDGRAERGDHPQRPGFPRPGSFDGLRPGLRRQLLRDRRRGPHGLTVRPAAREPPDRRRPRADGRRPGARAPAQARHPRLPPCHLAAGARTAARPPSTRAGWTAHRAGRARAPAWRPCTPRASCRCDTDFEHGR